MRNKEIYDLNITTDQIKQYCSVQDRCQWEVIKKMNEWGLGVKIKNHLLNASHSLQIPLLPFLLENLQLKHHIDCFLIDTRHPGMDIHLVTL